MNSYRQKRNYENLQKRIYTGTGKYDIPVLEPTQFDGDCSFVGFNYAKQTGDKNKYGVHFFVDDYQFIRLWNNIDRYLELLSQFKYVLTPDFSTYTDFPMAVQIYNHYRKHWIGAYLQENDIQVIPTISWSTEESFKWCFDGEPVHSVMAVSSIGTQNSNERKRLFLNGYNKMLEVLEPTTVLFFGDIPSECHGNVLSATTLQERFRK
ncbi:MAG: DUF4417 domain-containing protein [Clostridiaceae bacterium]|nr:DUF4417 domain-containing protein [Clostridiaceae bacterium]